jgi:hypothetical protein
MSSSMETTMLLSDTESKKRTWKDLYKEQWEAKAEKCPAACSEFIDGTVCAISNETCAFESCFGRFWSS